VPAAPSPAARSGVDPRELGVPDAEIEAIFAFRD